MRPVAVVHSTVHGGAEAYMTRLYQTLSEQGDDPLLIGSIPGWDAAGLNRTPLQLSPKWGGATVPTAMIKMRGEQARLRQAILGLDVDYFHVQYKREQIGFTSLLAETAPVVWTEHGRFLRGPKGALLAAGYKKAARHAAVVICVSDDVADDVRRVVGPKPRIEVIENSVDTRALRPPNAGEKTRARTALGIADGGPVLLWIGRLHREKLPGFAIELAKQWPGMTIIAGDGELRGEIESSAAKMPNTFVLGHVDETTTLFQAADVMAFTSTGKGEGFPTTMIEAAAHGVAVVGNESSGVGRTLVDMGADPLPTGATVEEWVKELLGSISRDRSIEVRQWAEKHDVKSWAQRHRRIVESVL
jgi:glycosyltransferase involved in cell wall biosynthesis